MNLSVTLEGIALYSTFAPDWSTARVCWRGEQPWPETPASRPVNNVLAPTERRRAPDSVAIALYLAESAISMAHRDPKDVASVFASAYGDLSINDYLCETLAGDPLLVSPTKFHNSVHNAPAGYWTIGTGCLKPSTAVAAGASTFAEALLEAIVQVHAGDDPVLLVCADIESRGPLADICISPAMLGHALVLSRSPANLALPTLVVSIDDQSLDDAGLCALARKHGAHPMAGSLSVFAALARGGSQRLTQPLDGGRWLTIDVTA